MSSYGRYICTTPYHIVRSFPCAVLRWSCAIFFFFKQKTAYEMRISDWSSDVCSSDLKGDTVRIWMDDARHHSIFGAIEQQVGKAPSNLQIGRASCRERVCQYV